MSGWWDIYLNPTLTVDSKMEGKERNQKGHWGFCGYHCTLNDTLTQTTKLMEARPRYINIESIFLTQICRVLGQERCKKFLDADRSIGFIPEKDLCAGKIVSFEQT